jgi:hypothetical protein
MVAPHWSLKGEYLLYDLGNVTLNSAFSVIESNGARDITVNIQSMAHYRGNIARIGVNYKIGD